MTLTQRERQVAWLIAHGYGNKQIAATLALSAYTVKTHVSSVLRKLGARNRTSAAANIWREVAA